MKGPAPGPVVRFLALVHISRRLHYISYAAPARAKREREPVRPPPPRQVPRATASPEIDWPAGSLYRPSGTPASSRTRAGKRPFWNSIVEPFPASPLAAGRKGQARGSTVSVRASPARGPRETDATERGWSASMSMGIQKPSKSSQTCWACITHNMFGVGRPFQGLPPHRCLLCFLS
jgi:hypothetical protein